MSTSGLDKSGEVSKPKDAKSITEAPTKRGELLLNEFIKLRDVIQASDATPEQKKAIWSQFLAVYTGVF